MSEDRGINHEVTLTTELNKMALSSLPGAVRSVVARSAISVLKGPTESKKVPKLNSTINTFSFKYHSGPHFNES